jgi:hypothetical protein
MQNYYLGLIVPEFILTHYLCLPYVSLNGLSVIEVLLDACYIKVLLGV